MVLFYILPIVRPVPENEYVMKGALVVLVCVVTRLDTSVADFFSMIGDVINEQFESVWNFFKELVKRPVRVKRLNENDKITTYSSNTEPPEDMTTIIETTLEKKANPKASIPSYLYYFHPNQRKLILPIIKEPVWTTRRGWYQAQQPALLYPRRRVEFFQEVNFEEDEMNTMSVNYDDKTTTKQLDPEFEDEDIGVMMFI